MCSSSISRSELTDACNSLIVSGAGQRLVGLADSGLDRLAVISQRGQIHRLAGDSGDHRPENLVLALVVGTDPGEQCRGVMTDRGRLGGRRSLVEAG